MTCAVCGANLPDGARFCPNCGALVGSPIGTDERKMVTVLFADLVDSTGLAQRLDPERARELLGRFAHATMDELRALRGRPEKFVGDAAMAVFGLPQVHEDDAVRAVRAGLAIRARTRRLGEELGLPEPLRVRVGIESGEAATGIGPSGQLLVTGPVVNAAARLQAAGEPGDVLAGAVTHNLTQAEVSFGEPRDVPAKGFDVPLEAHPVEGLTTRTVRRTIPFVGRPHELELLQAGFERARTSARPVMCTVIGEPGIGKSRLADEMVAGLEPEVVVLNGRSRSYADTATFAPVAAIVRELSGGDDESPDKTELRLREAVERWCPPAEVETTLERLELVLGRSDPRHDESAFIQDVQSGFVSLVEGISASDAVTIVFEDVHTFRPPMLDLVERVAGRARAGACRVLVLALARPELLDERPSWGSRASNAALVRLEPLTDDESVELVRQASGGRVPEAEAVEIAARAGGNPFFIVETTGMLLQGDPADHASVPLPPTVRSVVSARLDQLPERLRNVARRASVFRYAFGIRDLAATSGNGDGVTDDDLHALEDAEIVVRDDAGWTQPHWRFRHETLREVAYGILPKRERRRLHEAIADQLLLGGFRSYAADHLELAAQAALDLDPEDRTTAERAVDALAMAGDRARRRMENRSAVDYYARALAMAGPESDWGVREARVLAGAGEARYWLGDYGVATDLLDRAVELGETLNDDWTLAIALRFLGDIVINVDTDLDRAEQLLARSLEASEALGEPWAVARTLQFAGWVPWTREDYAAAEPLWRRALEVAEASGDRWSQARALTSLSINHTHMDDYPGAEELNERASALAEDMGDQFSVAVTRVQRGRVLEETERLEEAVPCFDEAATTFGDLGARWELADALAERGIVKRELGLLDDAEADLRHAIRISDELGERQLAGWTRRALAGVAEARTAEPA